MLIETSSWGFLGAASAILAQERPGTFFLSDRHPPDLSNTQECHHKSPHLEQTQSKSDNDLNSNSIDCDSDIDHARGGLGLDGAEDFDSDPDGQNFDQEDNDGPASNSESGESEVFNFGYQRLGLSDEESEAKGKGEDDLLDSDTGSQAWSQASDGEASGDLEGPIRDSDDPDFLAEGHSGWADIWVCYDDSELEDLYLSFAPF